MIFQHLVLKSKFLTIAAVVGALLLAVFLLLNTLLPLFTRERSLITVLEKSDRANCDVSEQVLKRYGVVPWCVDFETDKGRFSLPERERLFRFWPYVYFQADFWNSSPEEIWGQLARGCTYDVILESVAMFDKRKAIVAVLKRVSCNE